MLTSRGTPFDQYGARSGSLQLHTSNKSYTEISSYLVYNFCRWRQDNMIMIHLHMKINSTNSADASVVVQLHCT